jgi:hypothetical protein
VQRHRDQQSGNRSGLPSVVTREALIPTFS